MDGVIITTAAILGLAGSFVAKSRHGNVPTGASSARVRATSRAGLRRYAGGATCTEAEECVSLIHSLEDSIASLEAYIENKNA